MWPRVRRAIRKARKNAATFVQDWLLFLSFLWDSMKELTYKSTLPVTRRLLSRKPNPPTVSVKDIRANRIRFNIASSYSSPFNVEVYEIEWAPVEAPAQEWTSVGFSDIQHRTVARLQPDTTYRFRVRSKNDRGVSGWCPELTAKTRQDPVGGGGHGPRYTWAQTPTEVTITFELPTSVTKWDVKLLLKPEYLKVHVTKPSGYADAWDEVLLEGDLYGKVLSFDNGSFWELVKEQGKLILNIMLEKSVKSMAPKFDYWRSIQPGHPELEIDTHKLESEEGAGGGGMQMLQPDKMDPAQLRAMGLGQYAAR